MRSNNMTRAVLFCLLLGVCLSESIVSAQDKYPTKPIEVIIPYEPGGPTDIGIRAICDQLSKILANPVVVVNKAGAGGILGTSQVVQSRRDGYTLLGTSAPPIISMPVIQPKEVSYDPLRDLEPLAHCASIVVDLVVRADSPFKKFEDLEKYVKENPGKLNIGIPGIGLQPYFNYQIMRSKGLEMNLVITKGVPQNITFLLGGHIDVAPNSLAADIPYIREGKFRPLALFLRERHPDFPEIPAIAEKGYPEAAFAFWIGFLAPKGIPQPVLDTLVTALKKVMDNPEVVNQLKNLLFFVEYKSPAELRNLIIEQQKTIREIALKAGIIK